MSMSEETTNHVPPRKKSRWGNDTEKRSQQAEPVVPSCWPVDVASSRMLTVTDHDACHALLQSAQARAREKEPKRQRHDERRPTRHNNNQQQLQLVVPQDNYYARPHDRGTTVTLSADTKDNLDAAPALPAEKPNFGLSGALAKDEVLGNSIKGTVMKFSEPPEARAPNTHWRLYVFKGDKQIETLHVSKQSAYLFGRNPDIADIVLLHESCSSQHAVMQFRALLQKETGKLHCQPYLMDLESTNGSFINGVQLDPARYYQLKKGDVLKFGASTREYVLLTANTTSIAL